MKVQPAAIKSHKVVIPTDETMTSTDLKLKQENKARLNHAQGKLLDMEYRLQQLKIEEMYFASVKAQFMVNKLDVSQIERDIYFKQQQIQRLERDITFQKGIIQIYNNAK